MAERSGKSQKAPKRPKRAKSKSVVVPSAASAAASAADRHKLAFLVVGMGASAGGLEAFETFFSCMPPNSGMAFVLVPHLDAAHRSSMVELLQRYTAMKVSEVRNDGSVAADNVYITPPNATLTLAGGRLRLATPRHEPGTVDPFFRSLAGRKRAELAEEGLARLAAIVESSFDAIIGMTPDGTVTTWNAGAERMYGYTAGEAVGSPLSLILAAEKKDDLRAMLERGRQPRVGEAIEMERIAKDGRRIMVASTVSPVRSGSGKVIALSAIERDITERRHAEERQRVLVAELNHRVKNTLATVLSLLRQSLRHAPSIKEFSHAFDGRVRALAKSHDLLAASDWAGADLEVQVVTALAPYRERGDRVVVSGDRVTLNAAAALLFGMILHELATNAAKHGALSNERGQVEVSWSRNARTKRLALTWAEKNGPHAVEPGKTKGFGMTLIERGLAHELKGEARFDFRGGGLRCGLDVPLAEIEAEGAAVVRRKRT